MADRRSEPAGQDGHLDRHPEVIEALLNAAGEPVRGDARLGGEMTDSRPGHAAHDRLLIANLVDRSVSDAERARGEDQLAACRDCTLLYQDLVALSAATRALPVLARTRDFTLTNADADRLRVRGWRRVLAAFGSSRDVFTRPLAMGLTTLGLAGLLVATISGALTGAFSGSASSAEQQSTVEAARDAAGGVVANPESIMVGEAPAAPPLASDAGPAIAAPAPSPTASAAAAAAPAMPEALAPDGAASQTVGESDPAAADEYRTKSLDAEPAAPSPMIVVASLLLLVGLGLFALRWTARRFGDV